MTVLAVLVVSLILAGARVDSALNRPFEIMLDNNEYSGVLVAISRAVPEDQRVVDRLQEILTETSQAMYEASNRRVYLKNITILLPKSWAAKPEYQPARTELFERANIRVDKLNPLYGDSPYVKQKAGCGEGGDYIHLTPDYVINKQYGEAVWGPYGKTMVHEWGHLRWGLFDEYAMDGPAGESYPHFYWSVSDGVQATRCSAHLTGTHINMLTGRPCQVDPSTGLPEPACRFSPDRASPATGSYMFMQFLDKVASFCHSDPSGDQTSLHNHEAPNKHNVQCGGRSAWDVMADHPDFSHGANPPRQVVSTRPDFTLIQEVDRRMVLVLDSSGSMRGERIQKLNQVAQHFIRNTVPDGSWLGIVDFATRASTAHALIQVADDSVREQLAAAVPNSTLGWTCIGCGLQEGLQVLEANGSYNAAGGILLVISDGEENQHPNITEAMPTVLAKGVIVDTIAYSDAADANLESLAARTGGMAFFYPEGDNSTALNDAFTATVAARASTEDNPPIQLTSAACSLGPGETHSDAVYVDSSVGANTTFNFLWQHGTAPGVVVKDPDGNTISHGSPQYHVIVNMNTVQIRVRDAQVGKWSYNVTNNGNQAQKITIDVTSGAVSMDTPPITVSAQVSSSDVIYTDTAPTFLTVFASVTRGYVPVLGARVAAVVVRPTGDTHQTTLLDDGAGADVTKNDGVYSGYFLAFSADGRYSVSVRVDDGDGQAEIVVVNGPLGGTAGGALPKDPAASLNVTVERQKTDQFQRVTQGGVFALKGFPRMTPGGGFPDVTPPSRITDLRVASVSFENLTVTLGWTAVGDDLTVNGPAARYDLQYSRGFLTNFSDSPNVTADMVVQGGPLSPRQPNQLETYVIRMPERGNNVTYVFAVRACDADGNCASESNKASASLAYIPPVATTSQPTSSSASTQQPISSSAPKVTSQTPGKAEPMSTESDSSPKPAGQSGDMTTTWVVVGSVVGGLTVVAAAVFILFRALGKASVRKVSIATGNMRGTDATAPAGYTTTPAQANPAFNPDV